MPFLGAPGFPELIIVMVIALLLFGKRLPEVARSLGKGIVEFKKGVRGIEDEVDTASYNSYDEGSARPDAQDDQMESTAPRFEPPETAPTSADDSSDGEGPQFNN